MFGRKKNNFYRYMFQKSFMPLFAMLVVISMAFLIFFRITVVREKQKDRENDQIRLETCVSSTELHMKEKMCIRDRHYRLSCIYHILFHGLR